TASPTTLRSRPSRRVSLRLELRPSLVQRGDFGLNRLEQAIVFVELLVVREQVRMVQSLRKLGRARFGRLDSFLDQTPLALLVVREPDRAVGGRWAGSRRRGR